jgi:hypothetical protein
MIPGYAGGFDRARRVTCVGRHVLFGVLVLVCLISPAQAQPSVARQWNELLLEAIRVDTPRPTVHARNLFHTSAAMYDAWAAYDATSLGYYDSTKAPLLGDLEAVRNEAVSYAAYRVLNARFQHSPGAATSLAAFDAKMMDLGYDPSFASTVGDSPAAIGNRIAATILSQGLLDGSNEQMNYADTTGYVPVNAPLDIGLTGTTMVDPNRWQPLTINGTTQSFLTPHWGNLSGFGLPPKQGGGLHVDATMPPMLSGAGDQDFKDAVVDLIRYSSYLDPSDGHLIDISPGTIGNSTLGTNDGTGHAVNPATGLPYAPNVVPRGDYGRVLAEFWADGPRSETPPGHWNVLLNDVSDHPLLEKRIGGTGPVVDDLEWDVKTYFALNGAVHNAAIVSWDNKLVYDYVRPISMVRYMGGLGQCTDPLAANYHPDGLPLINDLIETITSDTTQPGGRHEALAGHEGSIAIRAWKGAPDDPNTSSGVDWILAGDWMPYQADTFVTPAFAAFTSGHSTFSRASAEVLTALTGSPFFPGGLGEYAFQEDEYLIFENGPSQDLTLQWATYYDAADEAGISRLYGGIHVKVDDLNGRVTGAYVGKLSYELASDYFAGVPEPSTAMLLLLGTLPLACRRRMRRLANIPVTGSPRSYLLPPC